jgi:hypothetical protein
VSTDELLAQLAALKEELAKRANATYDAGHPYEAARLDQAVDNIKTVSSIISLIEKGPLDARPRTDADR